VLGHDTEYVSITVEKAGYLTFSERYPGLPPTGSITIALEQDPVNTPEPTPSLPPFACARLTPAEVTVNYPESFTVDVYNCGGDGSFSFHVTSSWVSFSPSGSSFSAGETVTVTGTIDWDSLTPGSTATGENWLGVSSGTSNADSIFYVTAVYDTDPTPTSPPGSATGDVWIYPESYIVGTGSQFTLEIHVNTGTQLLGAYVIPLFFDSTKLTLDNVLAGPDGFLSAVGGGDPGTFVLQGFDAYGTGSGSDLHILTLAYSADQGNCGEALINIEVDALIDYNANTIGTPHAYDGTVLITGCITTGDVNGDSLVDIVDALLTAQYYVGLGVSINPVSADANCDGSVDIVDALLIARYYVGLIDALC